MIASCEEQRLYSLLQLVVASILLIPLTFGVFSELPPCVVQLFFLRIFSTFCIFSQIADDVLFTFLRRVMVINL